MTTKRQCTKLLKPLQDRHDDVAIVNGVMVLKPVYHIVGGVLLDRTSSADDYRPTRFVRHLFDFAIADYIPIACTFPLHKPPPESALWRHSISSDAERLIEVIERDALPYLRGLRTIELYFEETQRPHHRNPQFVWPYQQIILQTALGNFHTAREIYNRDLINLRTNEGQKDPYFRQLPGQMHRLGRLLLAEDRTGLSALLHEWENGAVERSGLMPVWQSTPFVFER